MQVGQFDTGICLWVNLAKQFIAVCSWPASISLEKPMQVKSHEREGTIARSYLHSVLATTEWRESVMKLIPPDGFPLVMQWYRPFKFYCYSYFAFLNFQVERIQSSAVISCSAEGVSQIMDCNLKLFQWLAPDPHAVLLKLLNVASMSKHIIIWSWLSMKPSHLMASLI